jgi:hypothetical protein
MQVNRLRPQFPGRKTGKQTTEQGIKSTEQGIIKEVATSTYVRCELAT